MPKFEVTIERRTTAILLVTVEAETPREAQDQTDATIAACAFNADVVGLHYAAHWDIETDELFLDSVEAVVGE